MAHHSHKEKEMVNHPAHYGGDTTYEVIKVLEAWGLEQDALLWNAVKYIARQPKHGDKVDAMGEEEWIKARLEDLKKAQWYLKRRIRIMIEEADQVK
jgi:hypothetical protein